MPRHQTRPKPEPWSIYQAHAQHPALRAFYFLEWVWEWVAYALSSWAFIEALEYLGKFSVLFGVAFYIHEAPDRVKQKHYQAWQVINTAQGKGGSGGRIEALDELNRDGIPLTGLNAAGAFLAGVNLRGATLARADLSAADLRNSFLDGASLEYADLQDSNLRSAFLRGTDLENADLSDADLEGADLSNAKLGHTDLSGSDLRYCNISGIQWKGITTIKRANLTGVKNAPPGFLDWALQNGAVQVE